MKVSYYLGITSVNYLFSWKYFYISFKLDFMLFLSQTKTNSNDLIYKSSLNI